MRPRLLFLSGLDWFSLGVRVLTNSRAAHVAIVVGDNVLHAASKGVFLEDRRRLYTAYRYSDIAEFEVLPDVGLGLDYLYSQLGQPYDSGEVFSRVITQVLNGFSGFDKMNAVGSRGQWTCARFAMAIDPMRDRIPAWWRLDPRTVTPASLLQATRTSPSFRRVA